MEQNPVVAPPWRLLDGRGIHLLLCCGQMPGKGTRQRVIQGIAGPILVFCLPAHHLGFPLRSGVGTIPKLSIEDAGQSSRSSQSSC